MPTLRQALLQLAAIQGWRRLGVTKDGHLYGPATFRKRDWQTTLEADNRRVTLRLARLTKCIACAEEISLNGRGDHLIPTSRGGANDATNYAPLCKRCNSSKGAKDLLEWWAAKGRHLAELNADVLCAYVRLCYRIRAADLDGPAPEFHTVLIAKFAAALPRPHGAALLTVGEFALDLDSLWEGEAA